MLIGYLSPFLILILLTYLNNYLIKEELELLIKNKSIILSITKKDLLSEFFFLLSILFLAMTLLAFNKNFNEPLSWQFIILITSIISLITGHYYGSNFSVVLSLIGFITWWYFQSAIWVEEKSIKFIAVFTGIIFISILSYLSGRILSNKINNKNLSISYLIIGFLVIIIYLYYIQTLWGLHTLEEIIKGNFILNSWKITSILLILFIFIVSRLIYSTNKNIILKPEAFILSLILILTTIMTFAPENLSFIQNFTSTTKFNLSWIGILLEFILKLLTLTIPIYLIVWGIRNKDKLIKTLGLVLYLIMIIIQWIEWIYFSPSDFLFSGVMISNLIFPLCGFITTVSIKFIENKLDLKVYTTAYFILVLVPLFMFLFSLSSKDDLISSFNFNFLDFSSFEYFLLIILIYLGFHILLGFYYLRNNIQFFKQILILFASLVILIFICLMPIHNNLAGSFGELTNLGVFWLFVFNILLFLTIVGIILLGYINKNEVFINWGIFFTFILIFLKYFELFWSPFNRSLFFILLGILLLVTGWLMEKWRRNLLTAIKEEKGGNISNS